MLQNPTFPGPQTLARGEIETMDPIDDSAGKRQVSYYIDPENDKNVSSEVFNRKGLGDRTYSASRLTNEALRIFFMVRRLQKEYRNVENPYELVRECIAEHFIGKKKK